MKTIRLLLLGMLCCLIALPALTYAQPPAQANPADVYEHLLSIMEKQIVPAADAMPADKYNFAPTQGDFKGVRTFGEQVKHLAEANYGFFEGWGLPNAVKDADIEKLTTKDDIMKALRDSYTYAHAAIKTITAANAFEEMGTGQRKSTKAGMATFCIAHSMDHYGQMVVYLRMNSIIPPASRKP
ncbi:MAG TPA: DinB family protein [Bryocella sp.]|nr:DinB family protein [Bryocella sp.]